MITKGIIEEVLSFEYDKEAPTPPVINNRQSEIVADKIQQDFEMNFSDVLKKYRVRLPVFHGISEERGGTPTRNLPIGIFATMPGMEMTQLHVGDVVLASIEDLQLDTVIILGMFPKMNKNKIRELNGAYTSTSETEIKRLGFLGFSESGQAILPENTSIQLEQGQVSPKDFSMLMGLTSPVQQQLDGLKNGQIKMQLISQNDFYTICVNGQQEPETMYFVYDGSKAVDSSNWNKYIQSDPSQNLNSNNIGGNL